MMIKTFLARSLARFQHNKTQRIVSDSVLNQQRLFESLIEIGRQTKFGTEHDFDKIYSYNDYREKVKLQDYESLKPYIDSIINGGDNILWKGIPKYFNKTSGTTSGVKYIPMTKESLPHNIRAARSALLAYIHETKRASWVNGKMIFLSGSPELNTEGIIPSGRMSGIVNHHIPAYLRSNQLPSYNTNCIEDWELKLNKIVDETVNENMTLISGIPPWLQMYFDYLLERTGKRTIKEIFPNLEVIVHGGVNFQPYSKRMKASVGRGVKYIETYPASEGFIAYQDRINNDGLLLNLDAGIFYEFVEADKIFDDEPERISLAEVELEKNYALVLNTDAGLWSYNIGDTVKFVSLNPYRIIVTGRTKHFISAFGEHVIVEEVEASLLHLINTFNLELIEFTVAPKMQNNDEEIPYHEWFIELKTLPANVIINEMEEKLDQLMCEKNTYYKDLIDGNILRRLKINIIPEGTFKKYMSSIGKLGGQNKVPRLANNRKIADRILDILKSGK